VGAGRLILAAKQMRARQDGLLDRIGRGIFVDGGPAGLDVHAADDVLVNSGSCPQEFAGSGVQRPDDSRLAGNAGNHSSILTRSDLRVDPGHVLWAWSHGRVDNHSLEGVIEIPMVTWQVLEVPYKLSGVRVEGQRGIRIQEISLSCSALLLRHRGGHARSPVDQVQLRV